MLPMQEPYPKTTKSGLQEVRQGHWEFCNPSRDILIFSQSEVTTLQEI